MPIAVVARYWSKILSVLLCGPPGFITAAPHLGGLGHADDIVTFRKLANTNTHIDGFPSGKCPAGGCQSLARPCNSTPCDIAALERLCSDDPLCGGFNSNGWLKPVVNTS